MQDVYLVFSPLFPWQVKLNVSCMIVWLGSKKIFQGVRF